MSMATYKINGKNLSFDANKYLKDSHNIRRDKMPQVNLDKFLDNLSEIKKYVSVVKTKIRAEDLKATQNEINMEKILRNIQDRGTLPDEYKVFIASRTLNIIDGHHRHVQTLMENPKQLLDVYILDMSTDEVLRLFNGMKHLLNKPRTIMEFLESHFINSDGVGMGDVDYGTPTTADAVGTKGSGDIMVNKSKDKDKEVENTYSYSVMKPIIEHIRGLVNLDYSRVFGDLVLEEMDVDTDADGVIVSEEGIDWLECVNLPVSRKYKKMDKPFKVKTMEGITEGKAGDYLMRGVDGELYPCDHDIFHKTYIHLDAIGEKP